MKEVFIITAVGMGLVFLAILALWGLIALIVRLTSPPQHRSDKQQAVKIKEQKLKAASVAVALALAQKSIATEMHEFPLPPTALVSAWHAVLRSRMLNKQGQNK